MYIYDNMSACTLDEKIMRTTVAAARMTQFFFSKIMFSPENLILFYS